jgi:acetyl esterase/lipase
VLEWVAEHGAESGLDPSRIAVAGDSVGGNMTAALTLMAKQRSGPQITTRCCSTRSPTRRSTPSPSTNSPLATGSGATRCKWFWDQYTTDEAQRNEITASPLRATTEQLAGLPKALVITGEADVLRDEGEAYGRKLRAAGVDVTATRPGRRRPVLDARSRGDHRDHIDCSRVGASISRVLIGVIAGMLTHSAVVAALAALAYALAWHTLGKLS